MRLHHSCRQALIPLFILLLSCAQQVRGAATAHAERALYEPEDSTTVTSATFADYHALLDWYYAETAAGRKPDGQTLRNEIRQTMMQRLAQPQKYYDGTGYVPGEDEGWRPDGVDWETYKLYREGRNEAVQRDQMQAQTQPKADNDIDGKRPVIELNLEAS